MARIRGNPRLAGRHSGDQFDRGYQYSYPDQLHITLGPWTRVWPHGERNTPQDVLQALHDGIIRDGAIYALWLDAETTTTAAEVVGLYEHTLLDTTYLFKFWIDASAGNVLKVTYTDGSTSTTVATALTPSNPHVVVAPWQDKLYFSYDGAAGVYELDTTADTIAIVSGSPASAEFLLFLNDQLVAIYLDGSSYTIGWSANSDPTDWAGAGSGSRIIPGSLGRPQGFVKYGTDGLVITRSGAQQLTATGVASPSFRAADRQEISGALWTHVVDNFGDRVFYVNSARRLVVYDGQERVVSEGHKPFDNQVTLYASKRVNTIVVSDPVDAITALLSLEIMDWVGTKDAGWDWISDGPGSHTEGYLYGINNTASDYIQNELYLGNAFPTIPTVRTGLYYLGREVWLDRLDLIFTDEGTPKYPHLTLNIRSGLNQKSSVVYDDSDTEIVYEGDYASYYVSRPTKTIEIDFGGTLNVTGDGPWLLDDIDAQGNVPVDATNPSDGYRAGDAAGNADIGNGLLYYGDSIDAKGNLVLIEESEFWDADSGIERIEIYGWETEPGARQLVGSAP